MDIEIAGDLIFSAALLAGYDHRLGGFCQRIDLPLHHSQGAGGRVKAVVIVALRLIPVEEENALPAGSHRHFGFPDPKQRVAVFVQLHPFSADFEEDVFDGLHPLNPFRRHCG